MTHGTPGVNIEIMASTGKPSQRRRTSGPRGRGRVYNIREVAEAAGTSVATISRALQRPQVVAPATLRRVLAVIEKLGYIPSAQPKMLRTARTNIIVALVPDISNPFFSEVIRGIEQIAHEHGYSVLLGDTQKSRDRETVYAQLLATRQADGIITLLPHLPSIAAVGRLPLVNACEYFKDSSVTRVFVDNRKAAQEATAYLVSLGHREIAFLSGPMNTQICVDRDAGYDLALRAGDIKRDPELTVLGDFSIESGMLAVENLLAAKQTFTAVFCANDEMAMGAMHALKDHGFRIPEDVSVIGFDDIRYARHTDPPLTTVAQPMSALGRKAMELLLEILERPQTPARKVVLPTELIIRGSTGKRRRAAA
jgi:LacI family repressor for deo operon, udp, cdd, tsx, nupC, and nupG